MINIKSYKFQSNKKLKNDDLVESTLQRSLCSLPG